MFCAVTVNVCESMGCTICLHVLVKCVCVGAFLLVSADRVGGWICDVYM